MRHSSSGILYLHFIYIIRRRRLDDRVEKNFLSQGCIRDERVFFYERLLRTAMADLLGGRVLVCVMPNAERGGRTGRRRRGAGWGKGNPLCVGHITWTIIILTLLEWDLASGISGNKEEKNTASRLGFFTASTVPCNDIPYGYDIRILILLFVGPWLV